MYQHRLFHVTVTKSLALAVAQSAGDLKLPESDTEGAKQQSNRCYGLSTRYTRSRDAKQAFAQGRAVR